MQLLSYLIIFMSWNFMMHITKKLYWLFFFIFTCDFIFSQDYQTQLQKPTISSYFTLRNAGIALGLGTLAVLGVYGAYNPDFIYNFMNKPVQAQDVEKDMSDVKVDLSDKNLQIIDTQLEQKEDVQVTTKTLPQFFDKATELKPESVEVAAAVGAMYGVKTIATGATHGAYGFGDVKMKISEQNPRIAKIIQKDPMWQAGKKVAETGGTVAQSVRAGVKAGGRYVLPVTLMATAFGLGLANLGIVEKMQDFPYLDFNTSAAHDTFDVVHSQI
jgi:hypothetical protein